MTIFAHALLLTLASRPNKGLKALNWCSGGQCKGHTKAKNTIQGDKKRLLQLFAAGMKKEKKQSKRMYVWAACGEGVSKCPKMAFISGPLAFKFAQVWCRKVAQFGIKSARNAFGVARFVVGSSGVA